MVQNLKAYFILCVFAIKCMKCVQEKIQLSNKSQTPRLSSTTVSEGLSLAIKVKQQ